MKLQYYSGSLFSFNCFYCRFAECMSVNFEFPLKNSFSQDLHHCILRNQSGHYKHLKIDFFNVMMFSKCLKGTYIDTFILFAVNIFKPKFWNASLKRHLAAFKTDFLVIT